MGYKLICYDKDEEIMFLTKQFPSVYVNNTVSKIGANAFQNVSTIKSMTFTEATEVGENAFYGCGAEYFSFPKLESIGSYAFAYCSSLSEVNLPECSSANTYIFNNCSSLSSFRMPKLKIAQFGLVRYCQTLSEIYLDTIEQFNNLAIYTAPNLIALHMSQISSVPVVSSYYFISTCSSLAHIYVPSSLVTDFLNDTNWAFYSSIISGIY